MQRIRPFVEELRREFGIPYPLAHFRPFVDRTGGCCWTSRTGRACPRVSGLCSMADTVNCSSTHSEAEFLDRVEFEDTRDGAAVAILPGGQNSPVRLDPRVKSGAATVHGVRTEVLTQRLTAGQSLADLAREFGLSVQDVQACVGYEFEAA